MTKLTDIPGASEAFNICDVCNGVGWYAQQVSYTEQEQRRCENCNGDQDGLHDIHLEVDVEAMAEIIKNCDKTNVVKDGKWENYLSADEWVAKALSDTIPKWTRLVRK